MNLRERLREAYENVSFSADRTWTNSPNTFHQSNMELYLTEHHLQRKRLDKNRPRTVRECIPKSRLAKYSNYVYNESREMSYASSTSNSETSLSTSPPTEPWELPEVGELFRWFLKNLPEDNFSRLEGCYESPLLSVSGFEDKILKIQITEDRVKNIWNKDSHHFCERLPKTAQIVVNFFTSPMKNVFLFQNDYDCNHEWFRHLSITRDFDQLELLSKSFQEESGRISKFLAGNDTAPSTETASTEILYSEVLQGLSPSRKVMSLKPEQSRILTIEDAPVSQDNFTNYTVLSSSSSTSCQRTGSEEAKTDNYASKLMPKPVYCQERCKHPTSQFQADSNQRHNRAYPFTTSYVQQTYFYSPVQSVQRWIPSSFYPTQVFTSSWYAQNPVMSTAYEVNRIFGPPLVYAKADEKEAGEEDLARFKEETEEASPFFEEFPVSASISEELEIQALEQYSNSNENFYQELERQAAEQYDD